MKSKIIILTILILLFSTMFPVLINASNFTYVMDTNSYPLLNVPRPQPGEHIIDPDFNTDIERVSGYGPSGWYSHFYSTVNVENANHTYMLLGTMGDDLWSVNPPKFIRNLSQDFLKCGPRVEGSWETHWDPFNPDIIYFRSGTRFCEYNISTKEVKLIHDFKNEYPDATWIHTDGQGDPSKDGRYWAFMVKRWDQGVGTTYIDVVVYDKQTDSIIAKYSDKWTVKPMRWVSMSPSGQRVLVRYWTTDPSDHPGASACTYSTSRMVSFKYDFSDPVCLNNAEGHSDKAITIDGRDVLVYQNTNDDYIAMSYLDTGEYVPLLKLDFSAGSFSIHVSGNNYKTPGWVAVSTYTTADVMKNHDKNWMLDSIWMLELKKNPRVWRIGHIRSTTSNDGFKNSSYWAQTRVSISSDGKRVYFVSSWQYTQTSDGIDVYRINLPNNWWCDLNKVNNIDCTPPSNPTNLRVVK